MPAMRKRLFLGLLILGLPGVVLMPAWRLAGLGAGEDEVLYYYPSRVMFAHFARQGEWPWLNPLNGLDRPYLADPQSAVYYPPTWLFAVAPPLLAYAASLWLHYSLALWGMIRLLRSRRLPYLAAIFGAVAFAFSGFLLAHRAHFTMIHAACWTPWVFWRLGRYIERGGAARLLAAAGVAAAQCYAGHVQIAALCALGSLVFMLAGPTARLLTARRWLLVWIAAGGLFAAQAIPTWRFVQQCTRVNYGLADFVENTWNPISAVGWVLPLFFGQPTPNTLSAPYWGPSHLAEQFAYPGAGVLLLAWLAWATGWRSSPARRQWFALLLFGLLVAASVLAPLLFLLPGARLFRVPARALLLVNLALAGAAARALAELAGPLSPAAVRLRAAAQRLTAHPLRLALLLVIIAAVPFAWAWPFASAQLRHALGTALRPWNPALLAPLAFFAATLAGLGHASRQWQRPGWLGVLTLLLVADLAWVGWTIEVPTQVRSAGRLLNSPVRRRWLEPVRASGERLWVVTTRHNDVPGEYIRPIERGVSDTNLLDRFAALTDYGPLQPRRYARRFGFEPWGERKHPEPLLSDTHWMADCNVGWVLLCNPVLPRPRDGTLRWTDGDLRLFRYAGARGGVFLADATIPHAVDTDRPHPYAFTTRVDFWPAQPRDPPRTVRLVASRLALPGWRVSINGQPATPTVYDDLLLAVEIPARGLVTVRWRYVPPGMIAGMVVSSLTLIALVVPLLRRATFRPPARTA